MALHGEAWLSRKGDGTHALSLTPVRDSVTHGDSQSLGVRFMRCILED